MIMGIIKKDGTEIFGGFIEETTIGGNKTKTVVCGNYAARSYDKIRFKCDICGKEEIINKRHFIYKNNEHCYSCSTKETSKKKYGFDSPNKSPDIKKKQHKERLKIFKFKKYKPKKEKKQKTFKFKKFKPKANPEKLSKLRSKIMKEKWKNGDYDHLSKMMSIEAKKRWKNDEYRQNVIKSINAPECKKLKSLNTKKMWENKEYREKMSKIGTRISNFQKDVFSSLSNNWEMEVPIENTTYTVDFLNKKTNEVIECFGDYWHCNPKKYDKDYYHSRVKKTAAQIWEEDEKRIEQIESQGYYTKIIWESEWRNKSSV